MTKINKNLKPCDADTFDKIRALKRDNLSGPEGWIILNGVNDVCIHNQKTGYQSTGNVSFTRRTFKRFCEWYLGVKVPKPKKKGRRHARP